MSTNDCKSETTQKDKSVDVTQHAAKRIRQRLGINKKAAEKNAEKALRYGVTHAEAKGKLCKYLDSIFLLNYRPTNMRVYNRAVYLFRDQTLITVLPLPNNLWKLADKLQREKNLMKEDESK